MGFFSFIESFFFLSLGITFVLIFLMVFHFKQRVEQLEKKNENMLEVCNGLVQQIHGLKTFCISNPSSSPFLPPSASSKLSENITFSTSSPIPIPNLESSSGSGSGSGFGSTNTNTFQKIVVEDFEDEDDEDEDDEEEEDEDIDVSDELDEELFSRTEEIEADVPGMEEVEMNVLEENILDLDSIEIPQENIELPSEEMPQENIELPSEEMPSEEMPSEEIEMPQENIELPSEEITSEESQHEEDIDIKNLSLQQLRQLASNKGLSTNPNKMKKQELVQLLQKQSTESKTSTEQKTSTEKSLRDLALLL